MNALEKLHTFDPAILDHYRKTGESSAMSTEMKLFVDELTAAVEIYKYENVISHAAKKLMIRCPEIKTSHLAKKRIYEALSFFHVDNNVSNEVWDDIYADYYDKLILVCIADNRFEAAGRYIKEAHALRTKKESRINPEDLQGPTLIVDHHIKPEDLGFVKVSLHEIATKAKNGRYTDMINQLPISDKDKKQLFDDAELVEDDE